MDLSPGTRSAPATRVTRGTRRGAARRFSVFGDIERERAELDTEIANLRTFEREYRAQLKSYFEQQLEALDGRGEPGNLQTTDA